jgi:hypothetical protein
MARRPARCYRYCKNKVRRNKEKRKPSKPDRDGKSASFPVMNLCISLPPDQNLSNQAFFDDGTDFFAFTISNIMHNKHLGD